MRPTRSAPHTAILYAQHEIGHERQNEPVAVVDGRTGHVLSGIFPAELAPEGRVLDKLYPGMDAKIEPVFYAGRANRIAGTEEALERRRGVPVYHRGAVVRFPLMAHWLPTPIGRPPYVFRRPPMYPTPQNTAQLVRYLQENAGPLWP